MGSGKGQSKRVNAKKTPANSTPILLGEDTSAVYLIEADPHDLTDYEDSSMYEPYYPELDEYYNQDYPYYSFNNFPINPSPKPIINYGAIRQVDALTDMIKEDNKLTPIQSYALRILLSRNKKVLKEIVNPDSYEASAKHWRYDMVDVETRITSKDLIDQSNKELKKIFGKTDEEAIGIALKREYGYLQGWIKNYSIEYVNADDINQTNKALDADTVKAYEDITVLPRMKSGPAVAKFNKTPVCMVRRISHGKYNVVDGNHHHQAVLNYLKKNKKRAIPVIVASK